MKQYPKYKDSGVSWIGEIPERLKKDTYVLDFVNSAEDIEKSFQKYYKQTSLSHETDINKASDLLDICDQSLVYEQEEVEDFNQKYWSGADRTELDPILDTCRERFVQIGEEDGEDRQAEIKGAMKSFVRLYEFIATLLPEGVPEWEKKNTFFHFLLRKLPKLKREDWAEGLLELVDFDKYRVTKKTDEEIRLKNENAEVEPIPVGQLGGGQPDPNMETLDKIVDDFNTFLGGIEWKDTDTVKQQYTQAASSLQVNDEVRDALLNNDEDTKMQVIHDNMSDIIGILTANASELQLRYATDPNVRQIIDASLLQHLEEQFNPSYNEQRLKEKLNEAFAGDFSELCGVRYRALTEVIDWYFDVLEATTLSSRFRSTRIRAD